MRASLGPAYYGIRPNEMENVLDATFIGIAKGKNGILFVR